jgi:hypothetical protein
VSRWRRGFQPPERPGRRHGVGRSGITWNGWQVSDGLSLGIVAVIGIAMLFLAIAQFARPSRQNRTTGPTEKGNAGWLRGQATLRRNHRRFDGGPKRR